VTEPAPPATRRRPPPGAAFAFLAAIVAIPFVFMVVTTWRTLPGRPRTVELHMRAYAFNDSNPTLRFHPRERVRFVVTNDEESNVLHDFRIAGLGVPCDSGLAPGGRREVRVTMPDSGIYAYECCRHPGMAGRLIIAR
jgi:plastocyanin